jgi:hypothetical protein
MKIYIVTQITSLLKGKECVVTAIGTGYKQYWNTKILSFLLANHWKHFVLLLPGSTT